MKKGNGVRFTYPIVAPDFTGLKKVSGTISQGEKKKKVSGTILMPARGLP